MGGVVESATKIIKPLQNFLKGGNPLIALAGTLFLAWALRPKVPEIADFGTNEFDDFERGLLVNKQSNDANIPVIYGERLVGGTRVLIETSGTDNQYLYVALVMAEGEINDITEIRVDDKVVTFASDIADNTAVEVDSSDANFYKDGESLIRLEPHFGTDDQSASTLLSGLSNWGSNHRLRGVCYLALRFKWNQDAWTSIPKVQAKIQGKKVVSYNSSLVAQTAAFTTNPAWCILDYLTNSRYGKGLSTSEIDLQSFYDASVVCETQVEPYSGASNINIFDTNTALDTSRNIIDNLRDLIKGCRGYIPYTQGKYSLIIETTGTASITLSEDDIIGGYSLSVPQKNERYNRVICSFINPDRNYQVDEVQFPPIDDSGLPSADQHATMKTEDGGFLLEGRFQFPTLTSQYQAEEMAEVILRRSRQALGLALNVTFKGYELNIGDIVNITHASLGFSAKPFRVLGMTFNQDYTVGLSLVEHQDAHYTWATKTQAATIPTTNLPNPFTIQPPASLTLSDDLVEYSDGTVLTRLLINIGASTDQFVEDYEVEVKQTLDKNDNAVTEDFKLVGQGKSLDYQVLNVIDEATYEVRVRGINTLGVRSTYVSDTRKIIGATDTPADVSDFNISMVGSNQMQLSWTPVNDLDIEFYEIRYSTGVNTTEWFDSTNLVQVPRRKSNSVTVNAINPPYHLYIKAVDKLGNESANPAIISSNVTRLESFEDISTLNEEPSFSGTYSNTFLGADNNNNPAVTLDTITLFDDRAGNFDDADTSGFFFDTGGIANNITSSGNYTFNNTVTLDGIYDMTFQAQITMQSDDPYDLFDSGRGATLFDDAKAPFDGNAPTNNSAVLQVGSSTTGLGDISSYTTVAQQGTFKGRYFKFRALLNSADNKAKPVISGMQIKLVLEKRTETGDDIASGTSTKTITFTNNFYQTPNINITGQDLSSGDFFVITNKSKTGFDIVFKNSSNTIIDKQFDYQAIGYGLQS